MFGVTILGSGSAGNAALVEFGTTRLLVDAGLSARQITLRLAEVGVDPATLTSVLLTHEHCDHSQALHVLRKKYDLPIYCNAFTAEALRSGPLREHRNWKIFQTGQEMQIGNITALSFSVPHDAADPVGFVLRGGNGSFGVLTDLGFATKLVLERMRTVHTLLIETNHDEQLLQLDTRRPWAIKQRILSRHGHLSNHAAAEVVADLVGHGLRRVLLGHLSADCNRPELAMETVRERVAREGHDGLEIIAATQKAVTPACVASA